MDNTNLYSAGDRAQSGDKVQKARLSRREPPFRTRKKPWEDCIRAGPGSAFPTYRPSKRNGPAVRVVGIGRGSFARGVTCAPG